MTEIPAPAQFKDTPAADPVPDTMENSNTGLDEGRKDAQPVKHNSDARVVTNDKTSLPAPLKEEDIEYPHGLKLAIILAALCFAVFLVALDNTIISTAIPKITDQFNSITDIGW